MLTPEEEGQKITSDILEKYTPVGVEFELFDGEILTFYHEKEKLILMCLYNLGLEKFLQILPDDSKEILGELLAEEHEILAKQRRKQRRRLILRRIFFRKRTSQYRIRSDSGRII